MDNLNAPHPRTRSHYVLETTRQHRGTGYLPRNKVEADSEFRSNDHVTPNKRRKTEDSHPAGKTPASAISLDDSQTFNESGDELQLSPDATSRVSNGRVRLQRKPSDEAHDSLTQLRNRDSVSQAQSTILDRSSPEDEGDFTKASAKQRRADKDKMLESSPPAPPNRRSTSHATSPYFSKAGSSSNANSNRQTRKSLKAFDQDSPDALQSEEISLSQPRPVTTRTPLAKLSGRGLQALIVGNESSASITKPTNAKKEKPSKDSTSYKLEELIYQGLPDTENYVVEVDEGKKEISIDMEDAVLADEPIVKPRLIRQISNIRHGTNNSSLVCLNFSRSGAGEDRMHLKFQSHKTMMDFVKLLQKVVNSLKVNDKPA